MTTPGVLIGSATGTAVKRVNVQVPDDIHTRAKVIAVLQGTTLGQYLERAIRDAVERDGSVLGKIQ